MKPGRNWRILAHRIDGKPGGTNLYSRDRDSRDRTTQQVSHAITPTAEILDEVVVDNWLHLEEMDAGVWWMSLGGYHFWIRVDKSGTARITHNGSELESYGMHDD